LTTAKFFLQAWKKLFENTNEQLPRGWAEVFDGLEKDAHLIAEDMVLNDIQLVN